MVASLVVTPSAVHSSGGGNVSGWFYLKEGWIDDSAVGPFSDADLLQAAFDGTLTLKSKVQHPTHTGGHWVYLENIPAAKQKALDGQEIREQQKHAEIADKKRQKELAALAKAKARQLVEKQKENERRELQLAREAEERDVVLQGQLLPALQPSNQSPTVAPAAPSTNWFSRTFSTATGVFVALAIFFVGIPVVAIGAWLVLSTIGEVSKQVAVASADPVVFDVHGMKIGDPKSVRIADNALFDIGRNMQACSEDIQMGDGKATLQIVFKDRRLLGVMLSFDSDDFDEFVKAYSDKFGVPPHSTQTETVSNAFGAQFTNVAATWKTTTGTFVIVKYAGKISEGLAMTRSDEWDRETQQSIGTQLQSKL